MSITRKIFRIIQYISLAIFTYFLFKLIFNSFKYTHLKTLLFSASVFISTFLFLMLTENRCKEKKITIHLVTGLILLASVFFFNLILFEIMLVNNWQKMLLLTLPPALILAAHNQIKIKIDKEKSLLRLLNNLLLVANIFILLLPFVSITLPLSIALIMICSNFILSLLLVLKK